MKVLIIGGTRFLGRHLVVSALAYGHEVTLFNRGQTNPYLYPELETIRGDRETDLDKLAGRRWDAAIDTCGYFPHVVGLSAGTLKEAVKCYVFISSISVYADFSKVNITENDPLGKLDEEAIEAVSGESYGPLKALCERTVEQAFPGRTLIIRPGLIVGPHDPTDRFTYWPVRVARGGDVLAPDRPEAPVQIVDGRDLAGFILKLIENRASGIYNATGPDYTLTLGTLLETCKQVSGSDTVFHWASVDFLTRNEVSPWSDMPVWVPDNSEDAGFLRVDISKAIAAGLTFRSLNETVQATLEWASTRSPEHEWKSGLKPDRETDLLRLLKHSSKEK